MVTQATPDTITEAELVVFRALQRLGLRPGVDFSFQSSQFGGRVDKGGLVVDFLFTDIPLAIGVNGIYFHYELGSEPRARDRYAVVALAAQGITLIFIDEDDALQDADFFVREALQFVDHSRVTRGG